MTRPLKTDTPFRTRYLEKAISPTRAAKIRRDFFAAAGPAFASLVELFESLPDIAFLVKDAKGRIVHLDTKGAFLRYWSY